MQDGTARNVHEAPPKQPAQRPQLRLADAPRFEPVHDSDPSCRGRGTERIASTTTTIVSDPAPTAPAAGHFAVLDLLDEEIADGDRTVVTTGPVQPDPYWPAPPAGDTVVRAAPTAASRRPTRGRAEPDSPQPRSSARPIETHTTIGIGPWRPVASTPAPSSRAPTLVVTPEAEPSADPHLRAVVMGRYLGETARTEVLGTGDDDTLVLGRTSDSEFADDPYVERCHAALTATAEGVRIEDFGSLNGVFVRLTQPQRLQDGDLFRIGHELLCFRTIEPSPIRAGATRPLGCPDPGYWARISAMLTPDCPAATYPVDDIEVVLGRDDTHLQFPDDAFVDPEHCRVTTDEHGAVLEDLDSEHGTFVRVRSGDVVPYGSEILVGQTLVQIVKR